MDKIFGALTGDDDKPPEKPEGGITALEIADLPESQRLVMNILLRGNAGDGVTLDALRQELTNLDNLEEVLSELVSIGYAKLLSSATGDTSYKVNLRRKRGTGLLSWSKLMGDDGEK